MKSNPNKILPMVSVIIPLYNGEKYIIKCLESVRNQNYPFVEIIVVDDGSTDHSMDLITAYRKKHKKVLTFVLLSQTNQGQGATRNAGLQNVSGQYLTFLDQDDTLEDGILLKMVSQAEAVHADIVSCGYRRITNTGKIKQEVRLKQTPWSKYKIIAPWSKLYRTDFIRTNKISFLPVILGEDIYFLMQAYSHCPNIAFLKDIGYQWLDNANSVSNTAHKKLTKETSLTILFNMLEKLEYNNILKQDKMYEYFLEKTAIWDILYTARTNSYSSVIENAATIWDWFGKNFQDYERNPYLKPTTPKGEIPYIKFFVWGYMKLKKWGFENILLKVLCSSPKINKPDNEFTVHNEE